MPVSFNPASPLTATRIPYAVGGGRLEDASVSWDGTALSPTLSSRTLGNASNAWANAFLSAARFGSTTAGPTITTSGTSPNESLVLTSTAGTISLNGRGNSGYAYQAVSNGVTFGMYITAEPAIRYVGVTTARMDFEPTAGVAALSLSTANNATFAGWVSAATSLRVNGVSRINTTQPAYTVGDLTANHPRRTLLEAGADLAAVKEVLGTLIEDLKSIGVLA